MIVYKATNKVNGKSYVGQTSYPLNMRIHRHIQSRRGIFSNALRKYGPDSFEFETVAWCDTKYKLEFLERFYIKFFDSKVPNGYNLTDGGDGLPGWNHSEETRKKLSESKMGERNPNFNKPSPRRGKKHREESKAKDSESKKENWKNPEYRKKIIEARKSERYSKSSSATRFRLWENPEYRTRQSEAHKKPRDYPESYRKMAEKNKAHWRDPEWKGKRLQNMSEAARRGWMKRRGVT